MNVCNEAASAEIVHALSILSQAVAEKRTFALAVVMLDPERDPIGKIFIAGPRLRDDDTLELLGYLFARLGNLADGCARSTADPAQFRLLLRALVATTPPADATIILRQIPPPAPGETR
jgi:hypothetical protein